MTAAGEEEGRDEAMLKRPEITAKRSRHIVIAAEYLIFIRKLTILKINHEDRGTQVRRNSEGLCGDGLQNKYKKEGERVERG